MNQHDGKVRIGLFSPSMQGFYFGELINQIRMLCLIKDYQLTIISTGQHGSFDTVLALGQIDAAIIIKNSISNKLAEKLHKKIPCVSVGYDYFPVKIPVISSDHELGVELALRNLFEEGYYDVAFVGDISQYDIRKRYEAYCDIHDKHNIAIKDEYLFNTDNSVVTGGKKAARQFITQKCTANAVLIGSGLTGMGFYRQIEKSLPEAARDIKFFCFDAISPIPVFTPKLHAIDPNIHLIAHRAIAKIDEIIKGVEAGKNEKIEPKLINIGVKAEDSYDAFLATCVDLPELHNPNYMKAIISNMHEWPQEIANSNLDDIMSISFLFKKFMDICVISKLHIDRSNRQWIKVDKIVSVNTIDNFGKQDKSSYFPAEKFGISEIAKLSDCTPNLCTHIALNKNDEPWGFITLLGNTATPTTASSFISFAGYMESIACIYNSQSILNTISLTAPDKTKQAAQTDIQINPQATIEWNHSNNVTLWSTTALNMLGFESSIEINIYQHMNIVDRIHSDDSSSLSEALNNLKDGLNSLNIQVRVKLKTSAFATLLIHAERVELGSSTALLYLGIDDQELVTC